LSQIYEGMFLLDNQVVRADWGRAKASVTDVLQKFGAKMLSIRRWDERKLAYPIKGKTRGTYLLAYFEAGGAAVNTARRDFDLHEHVLRYLMLRVEGVPAGELELAQAEMADGFSVPPPPPDETLSPERMVFGEIADRPVMEHRRSHEREQEPEPEAAPAEAEGAQPVAATEGT
jgi:small subunit ribosomal protein S6